MATVNPHVRCTCCGPKPYAGCPVHGVKPYTKKPPAITVEEVALPNRRYASTVRRALVVKAGRSALMDVIDNGEGLKIMTVYLIKDDAAYGWASTLLERGGTVTVEELREGLK